MNRFRLFTLIVALGTFALAGCQPQPTNSGEHSHNDHEGSEHGNHNADNDHSENTNAHPPHGPHSGHVYSFDQDYQLEWALSTTDLVRIYILDAEGKKVTPVVGSLVIKREADGSSFELDPENPAEDGSVESFTLENKELSIAMNLGVVAELKTKNKTYVAKIMIFHW